MNKSEIAPIDLTGEKLHNLEAGIIKTLLYFDIFKYPLTKNELQKFCHSAIISSEEFNVALDIVLDKKQVKYSRGFYFVNDDTSIVERRIEGNILAEKFNPVAKKYSNIY